MDIVVCTDKNFVMPTGVMMYSACVNNMDSDITFHVVISGVSSEDKRKLSDTVSQFKGKSTLFYDVDILDLPNLPKTASHRITIATYYRLFLTDLLPPNLKKVIYLDGDIIVRGSLVPLWETDIENLAVAVSPCDCGYDKEFYERLNYPIELGYFNAGVMLINLDFWRRHDMLGGFTSYIKQNASCIKHADQDVLNYTLRNYKMNLPIKYNFQTGFLCFGLFREDREMQQEIAEAINDCVILHYTGPNPWYTNCQHPYRSSFFKYQSQTIWKDAPLLEMRPLSWRIRKMLGWGFRKLRLLPALPPYSKEFMDGLIPID